MIFWKKHGINILMAGVLIALYLMGFFVPFFSLYLLFAIVPVSAYFMHRYTPFAPPVITLIFAAASFLHGRNFVYLYFSVPTLSGQIGLFYALKSLSFRKGVLIAAISVCLGVLFSTLIFTAISKEKDFPNAVRAEVLRGDGGFIDGNAKAYFNDLFPTAEDKAEFRILDGTVPPDNMDEALFNALYCYGGGIADLLRERLLSYIFAYSVLLGGASYLLGASLNKQLLLTTYFYRPRLPVLKEIDPDPRPLSEYTLPKRYLVYTLPPVFIIFLLAYLVPFFYPVHLAMYQTLLIAPCALSGFCFFLYLGSLLPNKVLQNIASGAIILVAVSIIFAVSLLYVFAAVGLADYVINFRKLVKKLFDSE